MALDGNFFQIIFINGSELFLKDKAENTPDILGNLSQSSFKSDYIALEQVNTERKRQPVYYRRSDIFSVEKVSSEMLSNSNKIWSVVK